MIIKQLDFYRIEALTSKVSTYLYYKYNVAIELSGEKCLDVWVENKQLIEDELSQYGGESDRTLADAEKSIYFLLKDEVRGLVGITQGKDREGKKIWKSPYMDEIEYDTTDEDYSGLEEFDIISQKEIYYEHMKDFKLTAKEECCIDLSFAGYNYSNEIDVLVFMDVLETDSAGYVKTYFNRLCKKLKEESMRIGLR